MGDATMPSFRVVCFEVGTAKMTEEHRDVEAQSEQEAAERVCGGPLADVGKAGQLRAQVAPVAKPSAKKLFYVRN